MRSSMELLKNPWNVWRVSTILVGLTTDLLTALLRCGIQVFHGMFDASNPHSNDSNLQTHVLGSL